MIVKRSASALLAAFVATVLLAAAGAKADRVILKSGTVLEGTVIKQSSTYWVKTPSGESRQIPESEVASVEPGSHGSSAASPAAPAATARGAAAAVPAPTYSFTTAKANSVDSALAAVTLWQKYVDSAAPTDTNLPAGQKELARWKALAESNAEKIKGRWVGGDERKAILTKADALFKEADAAMAGNQTLAAVKKLEEAAAVYPNSYPINFYLAFFAMKEEKYDKATVWLDECLRLRPDAPEAMADKGVVLCMRKQYDKGIALLYKSLQSQDRRETAYDTLRAFSEAPQPVQRSSAAKEAQQAATLIGGRFNLSINAPARATLSSRRSLRGRAASQAINLPVSGAAAVSSSPTTASSSPTGMWWTAARR